MICQQYISKVKGAPGPRGPPAGTGVPRPRSPRAGRQPRSGSAPFCRPSPVGKAHGALVRASLLAFAWEFFHVLDTRGLGTCLTLSVPQFPHLLMGIITVAMWSL